MIDLVIAIVLMIAVVGVLLAWVVWADKRRRLEAAESPGATTEEVA
jgi:FlaG/FlaF family flagellin (archaellin)